MYKSQYESVPFGYSYRGTFNEGASEKPVVVLARQKSFSSLYISANRYDYIQSN